MTDLTKASEARELQKHLLARLLRADMDPTLWREVARDLDNVMAAVRSDTLADWAARLPEALARFTVRGIPVPQGSAKPFIAGGRARLATKSAPLMAWRTAIATAAGTAMGDAPVMAEPVTVLATFILPRPASAPKRVVVPGTRPDLDKLARALLDGITGVVVKDDSLVVDLLVGKRYGEAPGVVVEVRRWTEAVA